MTEVIRRWGSTFRPGTPSAIDLVTDSKDVRAVERPKPLAQMLDFAFDLPAPVAHDELGRSDPARGQGAYELLGEGREELCVLARRPPAVPIIEHRPHADAHARALRSLEQPRERAVLPWADGDQELEREAAQEIHHVIACDLVEGQGLAPDPSTPACHTPDLAPTRASRYAPAS